MPSPSKLPASPNNSGDGAEATAATDNKHPTSTTTNNNNSPSVEPNTNNNNGAPNANPNFNPQFSSGMNPMAMMQMQQMQMANAGMKNNQDMMAMMSGAGFGMNTGNMGGGMPNNNMAAANNNVGAFSTVPNRDVAGGMGMTNQDMMAQMHQNKRAMEGASGSGDGDEPSAKRVKNEEVNNNSPASDGEKQTSSSPALKDKDDDDAPSPKLVVAVPASKEGKKFYSRNDVLCGRGGGTNVHPGNRRFRDLINANRRAYLKARKNDKPAISRSIVRTIREMNGGFLKKDEKLGLWFEIGDDGAREKTSQALRQRAPEMRKILFDDEQRQVQDQLMHRQQMMGGGFPNMAGMVGGNVPMNPMAMMQMQQQMAAQNAGVSNQMNTPGAPGHKGSPGGNEVGASGGGDGPSSGAPSGGGDSSMNPELLAKYNMLHQKNWLAQEKNMILQRLAMSGGGPVGGVPQGMMRSGNNNDGNGPQNDMEAMRLQQQAMMQQGMSGPGNSPPRAA